MPKKKQTIAVDIDDVLSFTAAGWIVFSNETWGLELATDDYDEDWVKVWDIPIDEALKRRDIVYGSGLLGQLTPNDEAKQMLTKLATKYRLIIVTSRPRQVEPETQKWLDLHFNGIFDQLNFTGIYDDHGVDAVRMTKTEILKKLGADYLIDDQPKHCVSAAKAGIKALLFGKYKWIEPSEIPSDVKWVKNWRDVEEYFDAES